MISTLIFILGLVIAGFIAITTRDQMYRVEHDNYYNRDVKKFNPVWIFKPIGVFILSLIIASIQPFAIEKVDAGNKGLKVNLIGNQRGVSSYQYKTGWVLYNTWTEQMLEFPIYQQHIEYDDQSVILKGGFSTTIKPTFNYSLREDAIGDMFVNLRRPISDVEHGWLKNAIIGAVNDVSNTWEVDSIFNHRQAFEAAIVAECNIRLSKWFNVSQLRTNIVPPEALQESIIAKTKAIQQAEASRQQAIAAKADGERKVAVARADSAETVINAAAKAKAMELTQQKLTPLYVEFKKIEKWNGELPTTVAGGTGTFLNIK
jgi:hypothetical protein